MSFSGLQKNSLGHQLEVHRDRSGCAEGRAPLAVTVRRGAARRTSPVAIFTDVLSPSIYIQRGDFENPAGKFQLALCTSEAQEVTTKGVY